MSRQPRTVLGRLAAGAAAAAVVLTVAASVSTLPAGAEANVAAPGTSAATATFHRYSVARELSVGHYSGARVQVTLRPYAYEQGRVGCVYNPLWLFFRGGWVETGLAHHCGSAALQIYGYVSCNGHRRYVERIPVPADSTRRVLAIARVSHGYALRVNGRTHARVSMPPSCLSPTGMMAGLESYSPYAVIRHQTDRRLAYRHGSRWYWWHGKDAAGSSPGVGGHWLGPRAWVFSENL